MLWGFDAARSAVPWPADVPAPPASVVPPPAGQGVVKHVIDGKYETAVQKHLAAGGRATRFNGHTWSMSYRVRIPEEDFIRKVRTCAAQRDTAEQKGTPPPACE